MTPELRDELADCLVYLVALSDALDVDVVDDAVTRIRGAVEALDAVSGARPLPTLRATATGTQLIVDGRPVLLLGGQLHNSSPSSPAYMEPIWDRLAGMGIRTVIGAASWAQVEPVEGTFDFSTVDAQIEQARSRGMRLVLIWFGAFKNAASTYAPVWVRRDVGRFPRAVAAGTDTALFTYPGAMPKPVLTVFSPNLLDADRRAFVRFIGAPGRGRPGPHRGDGPGRERGGPPPRQPRPVARGRGGVAQRRARGPVRPSRGTPERTPARAGRALGPAGQPEVRHVVGGLRRRLAGGRGLHGLGVRELLRRPRGRRQGGEAAAHVRERLARPAAGAAARRGTTRAVAPSAG